MTSPSVLETLKMGFSKLKTRFERRRNALTTRLGRKEKLSAEEEDWLDKEANLIDEQHLIDKLDTASDIDRGLERLDSQDKLLVEKLKMEAELGESQSKAIGTKRKRMSLELFIMCPINCFGSHRLREKGRKAQTDQTQAQGIGSSLYPP